MDLAEAIKGTGKTQGEIAEDLGIARETLSRWVTGAVVPSGPNLVRLADYLRRYLPSLRESDLLSDRSAVDIPAAPVEG